MSLRPVICVLSLAASAVASEPRDSTVKIEVKSRQPDLVRPWSKQSPRTSSGSGVMIAGRRLLTNAHVVQYASQIDVQPAGTSTKHAARVVAIAPGIDLALLELEDEAAAESIPPLEIDAKLPELRQGVTVLGYPVGGNELSITEGIVSRIEYSGYYYRTKGLRVQIDAALNPGNSGGPAVSDGRLIGLVFSKIREADNIGYLIPVEEIEQFLSDVEDGRYDGKATLQGELFMQRPENTALRSRLGLDNETTGLMVQAAEDVPEGSLRALDIITHVGPHAVDNQGFVRVNDSLRLALGYYIDRLASDSSIALTVFRDGESIEIEAPVERTDARVLVQLQGDYPDYFIWGPLVLTPASQELVLGPGQKMLTYLFGSRSPLLASLNRRRESPGEQIVVIPNRLFPHRITRGYRSVAYAVVESIDGVPINNLAHAVELLREGTSEYVEIDLGGAYETLVFEREAAEAATEEILTDEGIRRRGTPHLIDIWETPPEATGG